MVAEPFELLVHPKVELVSDRPLTRAFEDPPMRPPVSKPWPSGLEFYGMREYVPGDDLRRIVWRASARTGKIMVREAEQGITDRITIILDTDRGSHSRDGEGLSESFEMGIRAAASLGVRHLREGYQVKVETNAGPLTRTLQGADKQLLLLDGLARLDMGREPLESVIRRLLSTGQRDAHNILITPAARRRRSGPAPTAVEDRGVDPRGGVALGRGERRHRWHRRLARLQRRVGAPGPGPCLGAVLRDRSRRPMTATKDPRSDLTSLESDVLENLSEESGHVEDDIEAAANVEVVEEIEQPLLRTAVAVALPTLAAAVLVGGIFTGFGARVYAAVAGLLGVGLALAVSRIRRALLANAAIVGGVFLIGLLMVLPSGFENITSLRAVVARAISDGNVTAATRSVLPGWQALLGWLLGVVGFGATWTATTLKKPALGLLLPLPVAAIAAISVPDEAQIPSGIVAFVLFVVGLGLLSAAAQAAGDDEQRPPLAYELRRAVRSLPLIAAVVGLLIFGSQSNLLFPETLIDPAETPQKPKTTPISEVEDRPLFDVKSTISGPWRIGNLDVYDGKDWRLPPFNASKIDDVPRNGVVDPQLTPGVRAEYTIRGLNGTVLPGLPNTVGIVAEGPRLAFDGRSGAIRLARGRSTPASSTRWRRPSCRRSPTSRRRLRHCPVGSTPRRTCRSRIRRPPSSACCRRPRRCRRSGTSSTSSATRCSTRWWPPARASPSASHPSGCRTCWPDQRRARRSRSSPPRPCSPAGPACPPASATASTAAS